MEFNLADLFESVVDVVGEREALVSGDVRLSYRELDEASNRFAHYLHDNGIRAGAHVGLYLYNSEAFVIAILALFKVRAVPVNINYRYVEDELRYLFDDADLVGLLFERELAEKVAAVHASVPAMHTLVHVGGPADDACAAMGSVAWDDALAQSSPERRFPPRSGKDLYIIYTGGTTGMPKGVMWRHEDVFFAGLQGGNPGGAPIESPEALAEVVAANSMPLVAFPTAPFIHGAAQWAALIAMFGGGKVVILPGRSFRAERAVELIARERVNTLTMVGDAMGRPLVEAMEARPDLDLSSIFVIGSAGAILSEPIKERLVARLGSVLIVDSFGSTESGHSGQMLATRSMSQSGHPRFAMTPNTVVLDDELRPVEPGSGVIGRLARSGYLPVGYYNDPEKTAATFVEVEGTRYVIPGDMATVEGDGTITVFGRGAVCINTGGEKVFPEEVEEALKAHPGIADAIVVGVPDERWGQRVAAVIECAPGATLEAEAVQEHCRTRVAGYKVPRDIHFVARVERQPSGKPDYKWARELAMGC